MIMRITFTILLALITLSTQAQITFSDQSSNLFYQFVNSGAPIGVADMNGDGLDDIIRLDEASTLRFDYQPAMGNSFTGYTHGQLQGTQWGMCIADADENGYNDLLTGGGFNGLKLLKANNNGTSYTLNTISILPIFMQGANFADIDNDGDSDIFACNDVGLSHSYNNNGSGSMTYDQTLINTASTVPSDNSGNYGSVWTDYDSDGDLDLYISKCRQGVTDPNDGRRLNLLFQNDGQGNYVDVAEEAGLLPKGQSWATDFADIDNDGDLDCFVINHDIPCNLYINNGLNYFTDEIAASGMAIPLSTAGNGIQCKFIDFDNDTYVDLLYSTNGANHLLFRNNGNQTFTEVTNWIPTNGRIHSFASGDLNNDGFVDFIAGFANEFNTPNTQVNDKLFINNGNDNHYFKVRLNGLFSNENGIGARLEIYGAWGKQIREIRSGESYGITTSLSAHFGLGTATAIDSLIVRWPAGYVDKIENPEIDQTLVVNEGFNCEAIANFSTEVNGNTVSFFDQSSAGTTNYFWNFGDGSTSFAENPQHTYAEAGIYEVCLSINGTCGSDQICKQVNVNCPLPEVDFAAATNGLTANFTGIVSGQANAYLWDFGDGTGLAGSPNATHTFNVPGIYTICFEVTNDCGSSEICKDIPVGCTPPAVGFNVQINELTLTFTDESAQDVNQWLWDFGDGNTSTQQNPVHTYAQPGTYTICLTGTSNCGSNQVCVQATINCTPPGVGFQAQVNQLNITFTDTSDPDVTAWLWDFGDGNTSALQNPVHTYTTGGTYTICLTATNDCGSSQVCFPITLSCPLPSPGFQAQVSQLTITFTDTSSPEVNQWLWDFGDGNTSTQENPVHTYAAPGTYNVCQTVTSPCGSSQVCLPISVNCTLPSVGFQAQINQLTVNFTDNSSNSVTDWLWDFDDGTISMMENPTHTFPGPGTYDVCLTVTNDCGSNTVCFPITVSCAPPQVGFQAQTIGLTANFFNTSGNDVTQFLWDFGDGNTSTQENPSHTYAAPGTYNVCLTGTAACGSAQVCLMITLNCTPPTAGFQAQVSQLTVGFTDTSSDDVTSWLWNFGDGTASVSENPTHTFPAPGTYNVCLTVTNDCGSNTVCLPVTVNCAPPQIGFQTQTTGLIASFFNTSGADVTQFLWDFGDGNTSTLEDPVHTYAAPGTYNVCLTGTSVCGSSQVCLNVTITCNQPAAGFQAQVSQLTVTLTDTSDPGVTQWFWDFGDGNTSTGENPVHTYAAPGTYTVCQTVTSSCGSGQVCLPVTVNCALPAVGFEVQTNNLTVNLTDTSSPEVTQWLWSFNDGTTSTEQNPTHTFSSPGTYTICLTATSICGSNQVCLPVSVNCTPPSPGFDIQIDQLTVSLTDNSSADVEQWLWDFGDGSSSAQENPIHTYAAPGTYTVCLTVTSNCSSNQVCLNITVDCVDPVANFVLQTNLSSVNFTDFSSPNVTQWFWNFGDGNTSTEQNPTHTYTQSGVYNVCLVVTNDCGSAQYCENVLIDCPGPVAGFSTQANTYTISFTDNSLNDPTAWAWDFGDGTNSSLQNPAHVYATTGNYTVCLTVLNDCGQNTFCQEINVSCPVPQAIFSHQSDGFEAVFNDLSLENPTSWAWNFGDGNTSVQQNPTHNYALEGMFTVCLTVNSECGESSYCETITITCDAPEAAFSASNTNLTTSFTDNTLNNPTSWQWNFGDGNTSTQQNPTHTYFAPGTYTVCLTVTNNCGSDQRCMQVVITCAVPQAGFMYQSNELTANFLDFSTNNPTSWLWDFGDGTSSTMQNPSHTFALPGTYTVCLTASSICGNNQSCQQVVVTCTAPQAGFGFQSDELTVAFSDNSTNNPTSWSWNFGDGTTATVQSPTHTYALPGTYTVCLTVSSICGTTQTCQEINTSCPGPSVGFEVQINELAVNLTDASGDDVTQWFWDFGDGNTSTLQNPAHTYILPGTYDVCLTVTSDCGSSEACLSITVSCGLPTVGYNAQIDQLAVSFTDNSDAEVTEWLWDFGDGNTSTLQNPTHTYAQPGTYTVCLTGTSICGPTQVCQQITVSCNAPVAAFNTSQNQLAVDFTDNSAGTISSWTWDFGDGNTSTLQNPAHTYANAGTYTVCLTVSGTCGTDDFCQQITVSCPAPEAGFNSQADQLAVVFTDNSTNTPGTWFWDFGDGNFSTEQHPTHIFAAPGAYNVCLTAGNNCGSDQFCQQVIVTCSAPQAAFAFEAYNLTVTLTDNSTNNPTQWLWDFGDGTTSNLASPVHEYDASGTYTICLTVSSPCGNTQICETVTVECIAPEAVFAINGTGLAQVFQDQSTGNPESWLWDFGDGAISNLQNPFHTFAETGSYNVCLTVSNACGTDTDCHLIFLVNAVDDPENVVNVTLSPNPATNFIQLDFETEQQLIADIFITDVNGRQYTQWSQEAIGGTVDRKTIEVGDLPAGMYLLVIETENGRVVKRFVRM